MENLSAIELVALTAFSSLVFFIVVLKTVLLFVKDVIRNS